MYCFTLACLVLVFGFLALLLRSRFGRALAGIRSTSSACAPPASRPIRTSWPRSRSRARIAGLAGFLFAVKDGFVNPELLSWHMSGAVLIMIILGGIGHLRGALIGAFAFALLQEFFKSEAIFGAFAKHWLLGMGLAIIVSVALLPRGLVGLPAQMRERLQRRLPVARGDPARRCMRPPNEVLLRGRGITRRWGGLVAVDRVSIELERGKVHAVIGTNGAGKSTLINMLSGEIPPSAGTVELLGAGRHALAAAAARARRARPQLPAQHDLPELHGARELPARRAGACASSRGAVAAPPSAAPSSVPAAREAAARAGLGDVLERPAGLLSHGQKRQLEIAMCLATEPQVLLLDEPLAGMGAEETERMLALAGELRDRPRDPAGRARHGCGVPHRRPHHRDGQRRGDRVGTPRLSRATAGSAGRLPRRGALTMAATGDLLLEASGIHAWYGVEPRAARRRPADPPRPDRRPARPQRHGQEHVDPHLARPRRRNARAASCSSATMRRGRGRTRWRGRRGLRARRPRRLPEPDACART